MGGGQKEEGKKKQKQKHQSPNLKLTPHKHPKA